MKIGHWHSGVSVSLNKVAGCLNPGGLLFHLRIITPATIGRQVTAWVKSASGWDILGTRDFAFQDNSLAFDAWIRNAYACQKSTGVRMGGLGDDGFSIADFHDSAQIHDGCLIADMSEKG